MRAAKMHNAEIHIMRADPSRHDGDEGFVWAVTFHDHYLKDPEDIVLPTRAAAAMAAGVFLDDIESGAAKYYGIEL